MQYNDIMLLTDLSEKESQLRQYYIDIGVLDWLYDDTKIQKIKFNDRIEYKINGKYHRLDGPAIDVINNPTKGSYYIDGEIMDHETWKKISKNKLRLLKFEKIANK